MSAMQVIWVFAVFAVLAGITYLKRNDVPQKWRFGVGWLSAVFALIAVMAIMGLFRSAGPSDQASAGDRPFPALILAMGSTPEEAGGECSSYTSGKGCIWPAGEHFGSADSVWRTASDFTVNLREVDLTLEELGAVDGRLSFPEAGLAPAYASEITKNDGSRDISIQSADAYNRLHQ